MNPSWPTPFPSRRASVLLAALILLPAGLLCAQSDPLAAANTDSSAATPDNSAPASSETIPSDNANSDELPSPNGSQPNAGYGKLQALPPDAYGQTPNGIPYTSVLRDTGANLSDGDEILVPNALRTDYTLPTVIGNAEGYTAIQGGALNLGIPFFRTGSEPEDANIKAGPFYVKFHSLEGLVLYDDNYERVHTDRRKETLVLLRLNLSIIAQLSDNLQFAFSGSIGYLPIQNQVGVQSNALDSLGLLLYGAPLLASQLVYDTMIAGWPVTFADEIRFSTGTYRDNNQDNFEYFQGDYLARNETGGYIFRTAQNAAGNSGRVAATDDTVDYLSNDISAQTDRLIPDDLRLTLRIEHDDLFYNQASRGLPPSRDYFLATLVSERENQRFKPYLSYEASYIDGYSGVTQTAYAGIFGPIDDQLFLRASVGVFDQPNGNGNTGELYKVSLDHVAGPYTNEYLIASRSLSSFNDELITSEYYLLRQTLGPTLDADLFLEYATVQDFPGGSESSYNQRLGGARLHWTLGPKTDLSLAGVYERQDYGSGTRTDTITGRLILNRIISDSLTFQLLYQYQRAASNHSVSSYYENLVYFRLVKFLD